MKNLRSNFKRLQTLTERSIKVALRITLISKFFEKLMLDFGGMDLYPDVYCKLRSLDGTRRLMVYFVVKRRKEILKITR